MLFDVRTKKEYEQGHIEGALQHDVMEMIRGIFPDVPKDEEIIVYCHSGSRSEVAKNLMQQAGFTNVTNGGGMNELMRNLKEK